MIQLQKEYKNFSQEFLDQHHDIVLWDVWHQIKALLLYPLNCSCHPQCLCKDFREKIVLSLNLDLVHKAQAEEVDQETLAAMHWILNIPQDSYFKQHFTEAYPLWLIQEKLQEKTTDHCFQIVFRLVWALLRLGKTRTLSWYQAPHASVNEAIELILGKTPLKAKVKSLQDNDYLCGEKGYAKQFSIYKPICHLVAAYEQLKEQDQIDLFSTPSPHQIAKYLSLSQWFREALLILGTPNVKGNILFSEEMLLSLPSWVSAEDVDLSVEPFEDMLLKMKEEARNAPAYRSTSEYRQAHKFSPTKR